MTQPLPADPIFAAIEAHRDAHLARAACSVPADPQRDKESPGRAEASFQCSPCMSSRSDEYRQKAAEAKNRAAQASSRPIKRAFQQVARNWLLLAEQMEWLDRQGSSRRDEDTSN